MRHRTELARRTARALHCNQRETSRIIRRFILELNNFLAENGYVDIDELGHFKVEISHASYPIILRLKLGQRAEIRKVDRTRHIRVNFSKSGLLKKILDKRFLEDEMEKYGVDTTSGKSDEELEKQAAEGCPECGKKLTKYGSVLICPEHGSAPFERKKDD